MNKFIPVTKTAKGVSGGMCIVNPANITHITAMKELAVIHFVGGTYFETNMKYSDVITLFSKE